MRRPRAAARARLRTPESPPCASSAGGARQPPPRQPRRSPRPHALLPPPPLSALPPALPLVPRWRPERLPPGEALLGPLRDDGCSPPVQPFRADRVAGRAQARRPGVVSAPPAPPARPPAAA
eukprot:scaffold8346_cov119-Isochrysis_galbana.AAC.7